MSEENTTTASCLCGAVKLQVEKLVAVVDACHCSMCRQWGGGPFLAVDCGTDVVVNGEENVSVFNSSDWAERAFCRVCGSHLYYRLKDANHYSLAAGLFEGQIDFDFKEQIFIDEKPNYYAFANDTHNLTGAEVFAKYAPPEE